MTQASLRGPSHTEFHERVGFRSPSLGLLLPVKAIVLLVACLVVIVVAAVTGLAADGE